MNSTAPVNRIKLAFEACLPVILILLLGGVFRLQFNAVYKATWHFVFYGELIFWLVVAIIYSYTIKLSKQPFLWWPEQAYPVKFYFVAIFLLYLQVFIAGIIANIPSQFGWHDDNTILKLLIQLIGHSWLLAVFAAITAGVTEELLIRGFMLPRLRLLFNSKVLAILLSSLVFAALHYRYHSIREYIFTFLIGIIFAVHYQKYKNIKVVILAHTLVDLIAFSIGIHNLNK